jgi:hypothetical protein
MVVADDVFGMVLSVLMAGVIVLGFKLLHRIRGECEDD